MFQEELTAKLKEKGFAPYKSKKILTKTESFLKHKENDRLYMLELDSTENKYYVSVSVGGCGYILKKPDKNYMVVLEKIRLKNFIDLIDTAECVESYFANKEKERLACVKNGKTLKTN